MVGDEVVNCLAQSFLPVRARGHDAEFGLGRRRFR